MALASRISQCFVLGLCCTAHASEICQPNSVMEVGRTWYRPDLKQSYHFIWKEDCEQKINFVCQPKLANMRTGTFPGPDGCVDQDVLRDRGPTVKERTMPPPAVSAPASKVRNDEPICDLSWCFLNGNPVDYAEESIEKARAECSKKSVTTNKSLADHYGDLELCAANLKSLYAIDMTESFTQASQVIGVEQLKPRHERQIHEVESADYCAFFVRGTQIAKADSFQKHRFWIVNRCTENINVFWQSNVDGVRRARFDIEPGQHSSGEKVLPAFKACPKEDEFGNHIEYDRDKNMCFARY